jgi:hypothetical protein
MSGLPRVWPECETNEDRPLKAFIRDNRRVTSLPPPRGSCIFSCLISRSLCMVQLLLLLLLPALIDVD